ncbi:TetR/AcrR family transcriptional regulator [Nocardia macrotermitis]|uniref:Putative HTH-type transcriptional regulator n=1 Tax=Nocardia macrotermitis TaxID=2585198 RepID=A0A7K0DFT0_9NOCA|nr:TetR/AcrR family transcriptional regulator [Nocardia macrotermitis]MQY23634.1 putative HTH-type transcriptional regulator [Nocardia macrotermitis]
MPEPRGRPRDTRLHQRILEATRELLALRGYAELTMENVATRAEVGKKTVYRRWPSKAPLVAEAVLDAYGRAGSFPVADTGDIRADLRTWLGEHAEFVAEPPNSTLIRAVIAAAAASHPDSEALYEQLNAPQYNGLFTRLHHAAVRGEIRADADLGAIANALIGSLLLQTLTQSHRPEDRFDGLLTALLDGVAID